MIRDGRYEQLLGIPLLCKNEQIRQRKFRANLPALGQAQIMPGTQVLLELSDEQ